MAQHWSSEWGGLEWRAELREVAEEIDMHESTVSRVTSNKYLWCERGTFELKYFFSSGVASSDGEGASSEAIKARIKALTDAEDPKKVLSDQKLVDLLKEEGFDLARRTVAKYRDQLGILPARIWGLLLATVVAYYKYN